MPPHLVAIFIQCWRILYDDGLHLRRRRRRVGPGSPRHAVRVLAGGAADELGAAGVRQGLPAATAGQGRPLSRFLWGEVWVNGAEWDQNWNY